MRYTGQCEQAEIGLYYYRARWYDPVLGRFAQADTIVPDLENSQAMDRYGYVLNNPLRYRDPSGRVFELPISSSCYGNECASADDIADLFDFTQQYGCSSISLGLCIDDQGYYIPNPVNDAAAAEELAFWGFLLPILSEPADWAMTAGRWSRGDFSAWDVAAALPLVSGSGARLFGKFVVYLDIVPTGQWHHVFSNKIMDALEEHQTLSGLFSRNDLLVRATDLKSHIGYQTWHRVYDNDVAQWLRSNIDGSPVEFIDYLIEVHSSPDMLRRFPIALEALTSFRAVIEQKLAMED